MISRVTANIQALPVLSNQRQVNIGFANQINSLNQSTDIFKKSKNASEIAFTGLNTAKLVKGEGALLQESAEIIVTKMIRKAEKIHTKPSENSVTKIIGEAGKLTAKTAEKVPAKSSEKIVLKELPVTEKPIVAAMDKDDIKDKTVELATQASQTLQDPDTYHKIAKTLGDVAPPEEHLAITVIDFLIKIFIG